jgi:hypothetical protein
MDVVVRNIRAKWRAYLGWAVLFSLIIVPLALAMTYMSVHEGDESKPYVPELKKIAQETPVYPGSEKTGEKVVLKRNMAYFFTSYSSGAPFADIKPFYERELPARGWTLPKGSNRFIEFDAHSEHYRRGNYFIAVERHDESNNFSIVFIWDPQ